MPFKSHHPSSEEAEVNIDLEAEIERQLATVSAESSIPIGELRLVTKMVMDATVSEVTQPEVRQVAGLLIKVAQDMLTMPKPEV